MLLKDRQGQIWHDEELDALSAWEIEELGLHVTDRQGPVHRMPRRPSGLTW